MTNLLMLNLPCTIQCTHLHISSPTVTINQCDDGGGCTVIYKTLDNPFVATRQRTHEPDQHHTQRMYCTVLYLCVLHMYCTT